jgi:hypothetical protein
MANPTPDAITAILAQSTVLGNPANAALLTALNTANVTNTATRATVPATFTAAGVFACLSAGSITNLKGYAALTDLQAAITAQSPQDVIDWFTIPLAIGDVTSAEVTAVTALVQATQADPSYPTEVSWAQANLGRPADLADIVAARTPPPE